MRQSNPYRVLALQRLEANGDARVGLQDLLAAMPRRHPADFEAEG
jgi:hypothetical protein